MMRSKFLSLLFITSVVFFSSAQNYNPIRFGVKRVFQMHNEFFTEESQKEDSLGKIFKHIIQYDSGEKEVVEMRLDSLGNLFYKDPLSGKESMDFSSEISLHKSWEDQDKTWRYTIWKLKDTLSTPAAEYDDCLVLKGENLRPDVNDGYDVIYDYYQNGVGYVGSKVSTGLLCWYLQDMGEKSFYADKDYKKALFDSAVYIINPIEESDIISGEIVALKSIYNPYGVVSYSDTSFNVLDGIFIRYYEDGSTNHVGQYTADLKQGSWSYYRRDASLASVITYNQGDFDCAKFHDPSGEVREVEESELMVQPHYPGGVQAFSMYVQNNFVQSATSMANNEHGTMYVRFVVSDNGKVEQVKIVRSISPELDKEAIRVMENAPSWSPGMMYNRIVGVHFMLPIKIKESSIPKSKKKRKRK